MQRANDVTRPRRASAAEIWLSQSMCIYLDNNPAKFHPDLIWNDGTLGLFWRVSPQQEQQDE